MMSKLKPYIIHIALAALLILLGLVFVVKNILTVSAVNNMASLARINLSVSSTPAQVDVLTEETKKFQIRNFKNEVRSSEPDIRALEKQLTVLVRRKVAVPSFSSKDILINLTKIKTLIKEIKATQNWDELNALKQEISEPMRQLAIDRHQVDVLTRWPEASKLISQELNLLVREVTRAKPIIARLFKKEVDLSDVYLAFDVDVKNVKLTLAEANTKMSAGDLEATFSLFETDFFDQIDNTTQNYRTIITISNLSRFASYFKQNITASQREIKLLQKKGIDTSELQDLLKQTQATGNDVLAIIKTKPLDEDAVLFGIQDIDDLKQDFVDKVSEVADGEEMSWGQNGQFFSKTELSPKVVEAVDWLQKQLIWTVPAPATSMNVPSSETILLTPQSGNQSTSTLNGNGTPTSTPTSTTPAAPAVSTVPSFVSVAPATSAVTATTPTPTHTPTPSSPLTATITAITPYSPIAANSSLISSIHIQWDTTASSVNYKKVWRKFGNGDWMLVGIGQPNDFNDLNIGAGTYSYKVNACSSGTYVVPDDCGSDSNIMTATLTMGSGSSDTTSPSKPTNLYIWHANGDYDFLSWTASTDDVGVVGYNIYVNGTYLKSVSGSPAEGGFQNNLSTTLVYTVAAYDVAGNVSEQSSPVTAP